MSTKDDLFICPTCNSKVISSGWYFEDIEPKEFEYNGSIAHNRRRVKYYKCRCNTCRKMLIINGGTENFITFNNPPKEEADVTLYAIYESDFKPSFKIFSLKSGIHEIYLMKIDDLEYPVLVPKERILELITDINESKNFVLDVEDYRYLESDEGRVLKLN